MATSAKISFGLYDTTAKDDSTPTATDIQPFVNFNDLKADSLTVPKYATLEHNQFLLDESFDLFPDDAASLSWGLWSLSMSDGSGAFAVPPVLDITFTEDHSSLGLSMRFCEPTGDYPDSVTVKWYNRGGYLIIQGTFTPMSATWFLEKKVEDFRRIEITFNSSNRPYRYLKLTEIKYGTTKIFSGTDIINASILEEIDPLSSEISINTFDFKLHSNDAEFSVLNPQGVFSLLQQGQKVETAEIVGSIEKKMGTFYLNEWKNEDENTVTMKAIDLIGQIDKTEFAGGIYNGESAGNLVAEIMTSADAEYELDTSLQASTISGWLPICTHREALQQVAIAIGAIVDCSRSNKVKIYPPPSRPTSRITYAQKFTGQTMKVKTLVTGVDITAHTYVAGSETKEIVNETLAVGNYDITFDEPMHSLVISGATITGSNANHAAVNVATVGAVVLIGNLYVDSTKMVRKRMTSLPSGASANVLTVKDATLVGTANASAVAARIYDYYQQRYENEFSMVTGDEVVSDIVMVDSIKGEKLRGGIELMNIDLTGGFVTKLKICGIRIETLNAYFTGEVYAGETVGVV